MNKYLLFAITLIALLSSVTTFAQDDLDTYIKHLKDDHNGARIETGFNSAGSDFLYGQEAMDAKNYFYAANYFTEVVRKDKSNAFANYQLGIAMLRLNDKTKMQEAQAYIQTALQIRPSLKGRYEKDVPSGNSTSSNNNSNNNNTRSIKKEDDKNSPAGKLNEYKAGDKVEVLHGGRWWPGTATKVEGSGRSVYVTVSYMFQNINYTDNFSYNGIRPATGNVEPYIPPSGPGGRLAYGDYVLTMGLGLHPAQKGTFTLNSNGTYSYFGVSGNYSYNSTTGVIIWESGTFKDWGKNTTVFTRRSTVSQIDITYDTPSGKLYYSAGHNMK
jgi:hypothetical protein